MTTPDRPPSSPDAPPRPRDAASLILVRREADRTRVLMGQRGSSARFMPSKFVFPGGAVEDQDVWMAASPALRGGLAPLCRARLAAQAEADLALPLALAAIRETFEETGLALGAPVAESPAEAPEGWRPFLGRGLTPALDALRFVFRAITPPTRPVRFDARFFLAEADRLANDPDDFSGAEAELSHLSWLTLEEARALDLPFITTVVLAEVEARLRDGAERPAPFFHHDGERSFIDALP